MASNLRHKEILNILHQNGSVSIKDLKKQLYVSEATVRRDLVELEKTGALKRVFGGAKPILNTNNQIPLFIRESLDSKAKDNICRQAATLIREGSTIFLDGSSTVQYLVKYIANIKDIVVVTYSVKTAEIMCQNHIKTYCAGGLMIENSLVCTGSKTLEFARSINTDICFLSCKGISNDGKFTDTSEEETAVRKAFMQHSATRVMLMTQNKFGATYMHTLCDATEIDHLFSDGEIPCEIEKMMSEK
jgi:DeoR/GlpR family transcriptional regulator of sugar metabolism